MNSIKIIPFQPESHEFNLNGINRIFMRYYRINKSEHIDNTPCVFLLAQKYDETNNVLLFVGLTPNYHDFLCIEENLNKITDHIENQNNKLFLCSGSFEYNEAIEIVKSLKQIYPTLKDF